MVTKYPWMQKDDVWTDEQRAECEERLFAIVKNLVVGINPDLGAQAHVIKDLGLALRTIRTLKVNRNTPGTYIGCIACGFVVGSERAADCCDQHPDDCPIRKPTP